ncbi:unnamed protein product [Lactuca saligna]|uniref:Uncharacterized protein n=1 Tax=Lactuca saligna TaxID=75948 RepID=A0AA35Z299_LACSI|nr:unnamed protein product [Lactuca saligna]
MGERISTSTIDTSSAPPPPTSTIIPTSVPAISPMFQGVMNETISSLFSSQSKEPKAQINEEEDDIMVRFVELGFNLEEENVDDNAIMSAKQFKILNSKLISIV